MSKVDVVVPCYNYGRFLGGCVASILNQSVRDVRVLIIDDSSTDDSLSIATKLAQADERVSVSAHPKNKGHIATYNEGIAWATSEYFLLLSADDLLVPGALLRAIEIMDENPDIVLTYGGSVAWQDGRPLPSVEGPGEYTWVRHDLIAEMCGSASNPVPTPTAVVRTSVQKAVGGYRAMLPHAGDMEMWLRLAANGSVARINAVQAIYRKHSSAMSNAYFADMRADYGQRKLAFDSFFAEYDIRLGPAHRRLRTVAKRVLAYRVFRFGIELIRRGRLREGVRCAREGMAMDHRVRYFPPLWHLVKIPGPEGRERLRSAAKEWVARFLHRTGQFKRRESSQ